MQKKTFLYFVLITGLILLIPLIAMQFTDEVQWDLADFIIAGALLLGTGTGYLLATRNVSNRLHRIAIGFGLVCVLTFIWAQLAVGII